MRECTAQRKTAGWIDRRLAGARRSGRLHGAQRPMRGPNRFARIRRPPERNALRLSIWRSGNAARQKHAGDCRKSGALSRGAALQDELFADGPSQCRRRRTRAWPAPLRTQNKPPLIEPVPEGYGAGSESGARNIRSSHIKNSSSSSGDRSGGLEVSAQYFWYRAKRRALISSDGESSRSAAAGKADIGRHSN